MNIVERSGKEDLAEVYVAQRTDQTDRLLEFVDACDPTVGDRRAKWVVVVSTQYGCPVKCLMCDAGGDFKGNVTEEELMFQVETVFLAHPGLDPAQCCKLKVQLARMGEPSLNDAVPAFLLHLKQRSPNVIPCITTIVPSGRDAWFGRLSEMRHHFHDFQLQFSVNSTDDLTRDKLMPYPKMPWEWMADYGMDFYRVGQRKVCLNFALTPDVPVVPDKVRRLFDPDYFVIKLTPLNPTVTGRENGMRPTESTSAAESILAAKAQEFHELGFAVVQSIGNMEENLIGSNCGQAVRRLRSAS
jgi:23S rRNA (adenine2503-C2)-methyltransferase